MGGANDKPGSGTDLRDKISKTTQKFDKRLRKTVDQILEDGLEKSLIESAETGARKGRWISTILKRDNLNNIQHEKLCSGIIDRLALNGIVATIEHHKGCISCRTIGNSRCCDLEWHYGIMVVEFEFD